LTAQISKQKSNSGMTHLSNVETPGTNNFGNNPDALWDALHAGDPGTPPEGTTSISLRNTDGKISRATRNI